MGYNYDEGAAGRSFLGAAGLILVIAVPPVGLPMLLVWAILQHAESKKKKAAREARRSAADAKAFRERINRGTRGLS